MTGLQRALPASYYLDQAAFDRERERLLLGEWFCAGRADQVERPGSLVVVDVAGESVLLVRTRAGELRAHYNVCRHRGSQLVPCPPADPGGPQASPARKAGSLRCPYHSWTYRLDGDLLKTPWSEEIDGFDQAGFGLHPVGVATWGGFVFLHLTPREAVPLADQLGPVPERLRRYPLAELSVGRRLDYQVKATWKLVAENYNECYHCAGVHPELCRVVPAFKRGGAGLDWDRGVTHREGAWTFTATGRTGPRSSASCCSTPTSRPAQGSTPPTRPTCGTWSTARTGPCARASSAACRRAPIPAAGSPPWRSRASTSAATSSTAWRTRSDQALRRRGGRAGGAGQRRRLGPGQGRGQGPGAGAVRARAPPGASHDHARIIRRSY